MRKKQRKPVKQQASQRTAKQSSDVKKLMAQEAFIERVTRGKPKSAKEQQLEQEISAATGKKYKGKR